MKHLAKRILEIVGAAGYLIVMLLLVLFAAIVAGLAELCPKKDDMHDRIADYKYDDYETPSKTS